MGTPRAKVIAQHMTIKYGPSREEIAKTPIGSSVSLSVIGFATDQKCQAVVVRCEKAPSANPVPHITVSVQGVRPVYSNDLLSRGWTPVTNGPLLSGLVLLHGKMPKAKMDKGADKGRGGKVQE